MAEKNEQSEGMLPRDLVTSIPIGQQSLWGRDLNGLYYPIDAYNPLPVDATNLPLTAFGDLRVAEMNAQVQITFEYTVDNTEINTNVVVGSGTLTQASSMAVASTGTTTASSAKLESKRHARYRAGLGELFRGTALFTSPVAGTEQMIGLADEEGILTSHQNGFAVGYIGTVFGFHRWSGDVLTTIAQADWDDPMDGTGPSGMTLVQTNLNVYEIQLQYLGAGAITLLIEDDATGRFVKAHTILYANNFTVPSTLNPNYHLILHAKNLATTSDITVKSSSMSYFIEGKTKYFEIHQPQQASGVQTKPAITTEVALFTIRNKATYAGKTNFIDILLENITASIEANAANNLGQIRLVRNATLGGTPSWVDINASDSIVEIDTAGTTVTGGKDLFFSLLAGKNDSVSDNLIPYEIILSEGESLTIAALSENSATVKASLLWKELF